MAEPRLLEHRLLEPTNDSEPGSVSMWQECVGGVVWCALVLSPNTSCVAVLELAVSAQAAKSIVAMGTPGGPLLWQ
eukprot:15444827-Alexandrium_andersonii.AAC.1